MNFKIFFKITKKSGFTRHDVQRIETSMATPSSGVGYTWGSQANAVPGKVAAAEAIHSTKAAAAAAAAAADAAAAVYNGSSFVSVIREHTSSSFLRTNITRLFGACRLCHVDRQK